MYGIFCTIQDMTYSLYDIKSPFIWEHTHYIWHHIHCICVITSTLCGYHTNWIFEISSAIYNIIISIVDDITATECVSSHPPFQWYNTLCMKDIKPTLCIISYTLYKTPRPHFYYITSTVFMTSAQYILNGIHRIWVITMTLLMVSHQLYV